MDPVDRAHIQPSCRLVENQKTAAEIDLSGQHDFLLIAAGQAPCKIARATSLDAVLLELLGGKRLQRLPVNDAVPGPASRKAAFQEHILRQRHVHDHTVAVTIDRNVSKPRLDPSADGGICDIRSIQQDLTCACRAGACDQIA